MLDDTAESEPLQPAAASVGILLVNLGTPDAPTPAKLRSFLREFLSDRRVVDLPRWKWWPKKKVSKRSAARRG